MARTYKDQPYRIRKKRLALKNNDKEADCKICQESSNRVYVTGFSAIFYAHELKEQEAFIKVAEENNYEIKTEEVRGYLGFNRYEFRFNVYQRNRSIFEGLVDEARAIYKAPKGLEANLLYNSSGRHTPNAPKIKKNRSYRLEQGRLIFSRDVDDFYAPIPEVSSKENIFTVITVTRTIERQAKHYWHDHESTDAYSYLLYGHCHCSWCEPETEGEKVKLRSVESKLRNAFNSGDMEAVEEIASDLYASSGNAKRTWYC